MKLKVPIVQAVEWDWLDEQLRRAASAAVIEYDGGEEQGPFEVFDFEDVSSERLAEIVEPVINRAGMAFNLLVEDDAVTVTFPVMANHQWIIPLGPKRHPYDKTFSKVCRETSDDEQLSRWWVATGYRTLYVQQGHNNGETPWAFASDNPGELLVGAQVDLGLLDDDHPDPAIVEEMARANLWDILEQVARHTDRPLPEVRVSV